VAGVVGFVVAGGRSTRMGRDKALLPWAQGTLLDHAVARLRGACADVHILSGPSPRYQDRGLPVHTDAVVDAGPLGGLLTALEAADGRPVLLLGVDLPFVPEALLRALAAAAPAWDVVSPVLASRPEPLCASYGAAAAVPVRDRLEAGDYKMTSFWPSVRVRTLAEDELRAFGDPPSLFRNLNDPAAYDDARRSRP
jgi:molybdopterin-guanine dinucleotide biosynthesis protein A